MSTEKTAAIVIRQADFSESSRVVTFFSRDFGKLAALAKGAKRLKGPFDAGLDLLSICQIVFIRKSSTSLDLLTEAKLVQRFRPQTRDLACLYGGYYVAELLNALTEDYDPHPSLFDLTEETLSRLAEGTRPQVAILRFELSLLREIGQLPAFDVCVACGQPVRPGQRYGFWVSQGGLICGSCQHEAYRDRDIPSGTVALLTRLATAPQSTIDHLMLSPQQQRQIRALVTSAISHTLGRRPKMLRYIIQS